MAHNRLISIIIMKPLQHINPNGRNIFSVGCYPSGTYITRITINYILIIDVR